MAEPLVSIIIPTYNRSHLIGETLDSVLAQTYQNWECIVVDDGSTDNTDEMMAEYCEKDSRIKYFHRPKEHLSGGCGARNYGFEVSKGDYIQWFDSDDLMMPKKLEIKVNTILERKVDFIISKTRYYNRENYNDYAYAYNVEDVNLMSYTAQGIGWYTPDMLIDRKIAQRISFNERLKSGHEGNYSYKLLLETNSLAKVDEFLTLRRYHRDSIGVIRRKNQDVFLETTFNSNWITINELREKYSLPRNFEKYVFLKSIKLYFEHRNIKNNHKKIKVENRFHVLLWKIMGFKAIYFYLGSIANSFTGKYFFFYSKMK